MMSTSCWMPRRRLSLVTIVLVALIELMTASHLPKEHEPGMHGGLYAPLVFPSDERKFGGSGYLTPQNSTHTKPAQITQSAETQSNSSIVPTNLTKLKNIPTSKSRDSLNINEEKVANISVETDVEEATQIDGELKVGSAQDYSQSGGRSLNEQELNINITSNVTKIEGKEQTLAMLLLKTPQLEERASNKVENLTSNSVTETTKKLNILERGVAFTDSHATHNHLSGKGGPTPFLQSPEAAIVMAAVFVATALIGYFGLVCWRRVLEKKYGNRELLVNEDEFTDVGDAKYYEL